MRLMQQWIVWKKHWKNIGKTIAKKLSAAASK
jgi:hypothetical protein